MFKKVVIVFEGIESSGKTSHCRFISKYLKKKKIDHVTIREPGGSQNSEKRPLATKIIGNEQISGCILQPHYFVIIDR